MSWATRFPLGWGRFPYMRFAHLPPPASRTPKSCHAGQCDDRQCPYPLDCRIGIGTVVTDSRAPRGASEEDRMLRRKKSKADEVKDKAAEFQEKATETIGPKVSDARDAAESAFESVRDDIAPAI